MNPIIKGLEAQFGNDVGRVLIIENFNSIEGVIFKGQFTISSAYESMGNYTFMVQNMLNKEEFLFRLRRLPEVKSFRLYRLSLQLPNLSKQSTSNPYPYVCLPYPILKNKGIFLNEIFSLLEQNNLHATHKKFR